jgi:hypothetical protein
VSVKADIKYIGCYEDKTQRLLDGLGEGDLAYDYPQSYLMSSQMTASVCGNFCAGLKFQYSGVEEGNQCFCGNTLPPQLFVDAQTACTTPCSGDSSMTCGGVWSIELYQTSPPKNPGLCFLCQWGCISCHQGSAATVGCTSLSLACTLATASTPVLEPICAAMLSACAVVGAYTEFNCAVETVASCSCSDFSQYCGPQ